MLSRLVLLILVRLVHERWLVIRDISEVWLSHVKGFISESCVVDETLTIIWLQSTKTLIDRVNWERQMIWSLISPAVLNFRRFYWRSVYSLALDIWRPMGSSRPRGIRGHLCAGISSGHVPGGFLTPTELTSTKTSLTC